MVFNAQKCYILSVRKRMQFFYQLNETILKEVETNPYLGLNISNDMKWSNHINGVCKKASATLGFLRRNLHLQHCPKETRQTAYLALVRPLLEYGSTIWDPNNQGDIDKLEKIQRRAARFITRDYRLRSPGSMTNMLKELKLPELQQGWKELRLTLLFKIAEGLVPPIPSDLYLTTKTEGREIQQNPRFRDYETTNIVSKYETNNSRAFVIPRSGTNVYTNSFFVRTVVDWNHLGNGIVTAGSLDSFKSQLKKQ